MKSFFFTNLPLAFWSAKALCFLKYFFCPHTNFYKIMLSIWEVSELLQLFVGVSLACQRLKDLYSLHELNCCVTILSDNNPYETSRSVYSLLQICYRCSGRSADKLQIICRMSVEYLQNICRMSAERLQRRSATSLQICRRSADENQPIMLNKEPTKCTNQTTFI